MGVFSGPILPYNAINFSHLFFLGPGRFFEGQNFLIPPVPVMLVACGEMAASSDERTDLRFKKATGDFNITHFSVDELKVACL